MKRDILWIGVLLLAVSPLRAEPTPAPAKPVKETWEAVYIESAKAGYFHTTVREIERDGNGWRCEQISRGIGNDMRIKEIRRTRLI